MLGLRLSDLLSALKSEQKLKPQKRPILAILAEFSEKSEGLTRRGTPSTPRLSVLEVPYGLKNTT